MTEIKFETREKKIDGLLECHIYDVTGEKEIYAGCVKNFTWNEGLRGAEINRLEPFDANGERLGHGGDGTNIQELVDYVKQVHINRVERDKRISKEWEDKKEHALRLGINEEKFKRWQNVRGYIGGVIESEKNLKELKYILDEIVSAYESESIVCIRTMAVELVFKEAIDKRKKEIEGIEKHIEKLKGWIKEY